MIKKCFIVPALLVLMCLSCADNYVQEASEDISAAGAVLPPAKEEIPLVEMTFTASMPGSESRSVMDGGASDGTHPLFWSEGDKIGVIGKKTVDDVEREWVHEFTLTEGAGTSFGKFTGSADTQSEYHIIHPYQDWVTYANNKTMHMVVPAIQTATANTYDPNVALMVGNADDLEKDVTFKNVVSFLRIKPKYDCKSITIQTNNNADCLTGTVDVSYNDGVPTWTPSTLSGDHVLGNPTAMSNKVTLRGNIVHDTYYYIAVLPGTISSGFTVIVETCDEIGAYKTTQAATMLRSKYHNFTGFPTKVVEEYVDLGLPSKLLWANRNLGALMPYDTGNYYAWGEIGAMGEDDPNNDNLNVNYNTTTKFYYNWESYKLGDGSDIGDDNHHMSKYKDESLKQLLNEDDAAYMSECGRRMPTKAEFEELLANCYWVYTDNYNSSTKKGFIVYKRKDGDDTPRAVANYKTNSSSVVYSTSDTHIFLPFTGFYQEGNTINNNTTHGYYWCRDVYDQKNPGKSECYYEQAYDLLIGNDKGDSYEYAEIHHDYRRGGQCIRPVMATPTP